MQIYMQSDREEIEVFLCEDPPDEDAGSSPTHATSPTKQGMLSDDNLTDTETEITPTSSPLKQLAGHRLSHSHRIGYSSHDESLELSDVFPSGHLPSLPSPPPRVDLADEESRSSMSAADIGQIRDVLITATEDFDPIGGKALQTTDQDQGKPFTFCISLFNIIRNWEVLDVLLICREVDCVTMKSYRISMSINWTVLLLGDTYVLFFK